MPTHDFEIVTDSTCDIPRDELAAMGVTMVPLHVFVGGETFLDQVEISPDEFYDRMAAAKELPRSSQPEPTAFAEVFSGLAEEGAKRILSLHIAGALSGTANSASLAAQDCAVEVRVYDTRIATMAHGMMLKEAVRMRDAGETLDAVVAHLDAFRKELSLTFVPDTLENIVKNGRCTRAAGLMSSLLNIKAILSCDDDGSLSPIGKGRGAERALEKLVSGLKARYGEGAKLSATFLTVRNAKGCDELLRLMREQGLEVDAVATYDAGPVIATHTGAGLIGVACVPAHSLYQG